MAGYRLKNYKICVTTYANDKRIKEVEAKTVAGAKKRATKLVESENEPVLYAEHVGA
jgi:hypothetical protein